MGRFRTVALAATTMLTAALPAAAVPAWAEGAPAPAARTIGQHPGHPAIMYPGRQVTVAAFCPAGTKATGGGATAESDPQSAVFIKESGPVGETSWRVRAYNASDEVQTLHPRVICSSEPALEYHEGPSSPLRPGESDNPSEVGCGTEQFVAGGGFQAGDMTYASQSVYDNIRRWTARAKNTGSGPSFVRALVVCSDVEPSLRSERMELRPGAVGTVHVECPSGQVPTGGGVDGSLDTLLNSSGPTPTGWTVRVTNTAAVPLGVAYASVVCTTP
ncbi:hypothetical protein [Streptomyces showdoensis]|uniref:Uncharacterized protein n=1 Tax=Streptomyces showdoensis TaxID=68268 RepID=A0A2P2GRH5_STREW|nr:hypothetical protein [Streptomyces showdoensis]KKZ74102.1 hypothetical protein VO63_09525 [Streptomyces showdoensis]